MTRKVNVVGNKIVAIKGNKSIVYNMSRSEIIDEEANRFILNSLATTLLKGGDKHDVGGR